MALLLWPFVAMFLFSRFSIAVAVSATMIGGYLFLPERGVLFDLPALPSINKETIPTLAACILAALVIRSLSGKYSTRAVGGMAGIVLPKEMPVGWLPRLRSFRFLLFASLLLALLTGLGNMDRVVVTLDRGGSLVLPALDFYAVGNAVISSFVLIIPILLGRKLLADEDGHRTLLTVMVGFAAFYCLLALFEIRMSPQLNRMVYGFFPHDWRQHVRGSGSFRPIVFLNHGLWLGIFLATACIAAFTCLRFSEQTTRTKYFVAILLIFGTLFLSTNLGAFLILLLIAPFALGAAPRVQLGFAVSVSVVFLLYPISRLLGFFPMDAVVRFFELIDTARAGSFEYRLDQEEGLLDTRRERLLLGWSGFGRSFWSTSADFGKVTSDSFWIIEVGQRGMLGFLALSLLVISPLWQLRRHRGEIGLATSGICLIVAAWLIDFTVNNTLTPVTLLFVGALWGRLELFRTSLDAKQLNATEHDGQLDTGRAQLRPTYARKPVQRYRARPKTPARTARSS